MGFPDWFLFDWSLPPIEQFAEKIGWVARILLHLAALLGLLAG